MAYPDGRLATVLATPGCADGSSAAVSGGIAHPAWIGDEVRVAIAHWRAEGSGCHSGMACRLGTRPAWRAGRVLASRAVRQVTARAAASGAGGSWMVATPV